MASTNGRRKAGHILGAVLAVGHLAALGAPAEEGETGPPLGILAAAAALGVVILVLLLRSWRHESRGARRVAAVLLLVAALGALPGLLVSGVPVALQLLAGLFVLLTIAAVVLLFSAQPAAADPVRAQ